MSEIRVNQAPQIDFCLLKTVKSPNPILTCKFFITVRRKYKMKLNFSLDKLELYLDDDILLGSDALINAQKLVSLTEVEKNLFLADFLALARNGLWRLNRHPNSWRDLKML